MNASADVALGGTGQQLATKRSVGKCILLLIVSGGLWGLAWVYHTAKEVAQQGLGKDANPALRAIGMVIPIVNLFILYFSWSDIEGFCKKVGSRDFPLVLYFILTIFIPFAAIFTYISVQGKMNDAFDAASGGQATEAPMETIDWVTVAIGILVLVGVIGLSVGLN